MRDLWRRLAAGPATGPRATAALVVRLVAGLVFVAFGAGKFVEHAAEVESFRGYGLPAPELVVYGTGVVELGGGLLLLAGLLVRLAGVGLAGTMTGAIVTSGIGKGETVSLTLAPAMLGCVLYLLWTGAGRLALDRRAFSSGG